MDEETLGVEVVTLCLIPIGYHSWKSSDELKALPQDVFDSYVVGIGIVGVAYQNAASKLVYDIPAGSFENHVLYKSVRECSVSTEECSKLLELLSFRQITEKQQVGTLLETEPSIFLKSPGYLGDIDASVEKATVHGDALALIEDISVHVSNFSKTHQYSGAVLVSEPTLYRVLLVQFHRYAVLFFRFL